MIRVRNLVAGAAIALTVPAAAAGAERVVDYSIDEVKAAQNAIEQGVPLTPEPKRGPRHVAVETAPDVDHEVTRAGITCGSWKIQNPLSILVRRFSLAWDRDGAPANAMAPSVDLLVKVAHASTLSRCLSTGEMKTSCIYRVTISGSVTTRTGIVRPLRVERESVAKGIGVCAGITRGIGLVSRTATAALFEEAEALSSSTSPS